MPLTPKCFVPSQQLPNSSGEEDILNICQSIFTMSPLFPLENVRMFYSCGSGKEVENVKILQTDN